MSLKNSLTWLAFTKNLSFITEYYPKIGEDIEGVTGKYNSYAFGIKFQTSGHHFELMLSNSIALDARHMSLGTNHYKKLNFGFNVNRKF